MGKVQNFRSREHDPGLDFRTRFPVGSGSRPCGGRSLFPGKITVWPHDARTGKRGDHTLFQMVFGRQICVERHKAGGGFQI